MAGESKPSDHVSREMLYEELWSVPLSQVAEKHGLSDAGLIRLCKTYSIPRPSAGHWDKVAAGEAVKRLPLPPLRDRSRQVLDLTKLLAIEDGLAREFRDPELAQLARREGSEMAPIEVPATLRSPHHLVAITLDAVEAAMRSEHHSRSEGLMYPAYDRRTKCLDVAVGKEHVKRAMRIMDALVRACEERGYAFVPSTSQQPDSLRLAALGEIFELRLREPSRRTGQTDSLGRSEHALTGQLRLELRNDGGWSEVYTLQDGQHTRIEDKLNRLMLAILREVDERRQRAKYWAEERQKAQELERQRQEEQERRRQQEADRKALIDQAMAWHHSQEIRAYLAAVRKATEARCGAVEAGTDLDHWLHWAETVADSLDPLVLPPHDQT